MGFDFCLNTRILLPYFDNILSIKYTVGFELREICSVHQQRRKKKRLKNKQDEIHLLPWIQRPA